MGSAGPRGGVRERSGQLRPSTGNPNGVGIAKPHPGNFPMERAAPDFNRQKKNHKIYQKRTTEEMSKKNSEDIPEDMSERKSERMSEEDITEGISE